MLVLASRRLEKLASSADVAVAHVPLERGEPLYSARDFKIAARLGTLTALVLFVLIVLGSVVRTTGSGLACPDWPLCQGRWIPPLEFHVLIEWSHRAVALLASLLLFATIGWTFVRRETRATLGLPAALAVVLLAIQVLLGALTVWKLLDASVVNIHLATALLLFAVMIAFSAAAETHAEGLRPAAPRPPLLLPVSVLVTSLIYAQAVLGGAVSSQHAGLACPDWPTCNGEWLPPLATLAGLHMLHRYAGTLVLLAMVVLALGARSAPDGGIRAGAKLTLSLTFAQIVLGICNVLLGTPVWLSALHLATAAAILGLMVLVTYRVACLPAREARLVPASAP